MIPERFAKNNHENSLETDLTPFDAVRHAELRARLNGETNLLTPREADILRDVFGLEDRQQEDVYQRVYEKLVTSFPNMKPEGIKEKIHQLSAKGELRLLARSGEISEDDSAVLNEYLAQLDEINKLDLQTLTKKYGTTRDNLRRIISSALKKLRKEGI